MRAVRRPGWPAAFEPNAWLRIGTDESILVIVDRSEMGQGVATALPMLLAEELEADWAKVRIEFAPADPAHNNLLYGFQGTGGSSSVRAAFTPLRQAGAAAREVLIDAAAKTWGVDRSECHIGIGIQNFPEGMAVSAPLRGEGMSPFKSFMYGQSSALVEPVAGVIGAVAVIAMKPILPYALAFAAGAMIFVVVEELIPESQLAKHTDFATSGAMLGFVLMMILDVALG